MNLENNTKNTHCRFAFKPVRESQLSLVHNWLVQDHIKEWLHGDGLSNTTVLP